MTTRVRKLTDQELFREAFLRIRRLEAVNPALSSSGFENFPAWVLAQPTLWEYWPLNDVSGNPVGVVGGRVLVKNTFGTGSFSHGQPGPFVHMPELTSLGFVAPAGSDLDFLRYTLTAGEQPSFIETEPWTWMGWVYWTGTQPETIMSLWNGGADQATIYTFTTDDLHFARASTDVDSGDPLTKTVWHHLAYTYAGSGTGAGKLYLDGVEVATLTNSASFGIVHFELGQRSGGNYEGRQAQVVMFTSELSAADIAEAASLADAFDTAPAGMVPVFDGAGGWAPGWPTIETRLNGA